MLLMSKGANHFSESLKFLLGGFLNVGPYCSLPEVKFITRNEEV